MAKKAKARTIIVKLLSTAGTGFFYTTRRPRTTAKLSSMKFDPRGTYPTIESCFETVEKKSGSISKAF
ncbi:54S ribosomal protein L39, mitochondrial [Mortierella sp. AM989]|nr:54S ribosomal protein L39, mitochondrial [Mortierella sp. AM989]